MVTGARACLDSFIWEKKKFVIIESLRTERSKIKKPVVLLGPYSLL